MIMDLWIRNISWWPVLFSFCFNKKYVPFRVFTANQDKKNIITVLVTLLHEINFTLN